MKLPRGSGRQSGGGAVRELSQPEPALYAPSVDTVASPDYAPPDAIVAGATGGFTRERAGSVYAGFGNESSL